MPDKSDRGKMNSSMEIEIKFINVIKDKQMVIHKERQMGPIEEADQIPTTEDRDPSPPTKLKLAFLPPFTSNERKSNEPIGQSLPLLFGSPKATESPNRRAIYSSPDRGAKQPTS